MDTKRKEELAARYMKAMHAVQSGVAMMMNYDTGSVQPKHLRVGVNSALLNDAAISQLLIRKGIITEEEYMVAVCEAAEREVEAYTVAIKKHLGGNAEITLG